VAGTLNVSDVNHRGDRSQAVGGLGFELVASKVRRPLVPDRSVPRSSLTERLKGDARPVVSVVAPPGYGKTTLLSQWAERDGRAFAWVSVDEADNDPKVLLGYVATALDAVEPIGDRVFEALASPGSSVPGSVVPRLGSAFLSMTSPVVLVLDDVHVLRNREGRSALSVLADHVPPGSRLVLAGQAEPPLRVARLRAGGRIMEVGPRDLSLTPDEASSLLRNADLAVSADDVAELHRRAEGWPVGLYLAALYLRSGGSLGTAVSFGGDDWLVSEYLESEFLAQISPRQRAFLTRTAVLERLCGPKCDTVLDVTGSAAVLADLARSNLLLVPLDRRGEWYRYHHLFRDMLLAELHRWEPGLIPVLQRRAAAWHERNGAPGQALEYLMKAGDSDGAARLASTLAFPAYQHGRVATVERWFRWLEDHGAPARYPGVAVMAALLAAHTGKPADAERWASLAEQGTAAGDLPDGSPTIEPWLALLRAVLCRDGVEKMLADADQAVRTLAAESFWRPAAKLYLAMAHLMAGDLDRADALFEDHIAASGAAGAMVGACVALVERALMAMASDAWEPAGQYLSQARTVARQANLEHYPPNALMYAAAARLALHDGDRSRARAELTQAQRLRPDLNYSLPHAAVQARIELARCHLALSDFAAVHTLLHEADTILRRRPGLGIFAQQASALRAALPDGRDTSAPGASALTAAELRLLPMLTTHMSFPEISEEMFLSPHTIKSQAYSIYRKLGASSRHQAVTRSRELGLLEGYAAGSMAGKLQVPLRISARGR
jgi:LuxR family transcriptional regulator, maltose regulon positive regulatory protein